MIPGLILLACLFIACLLATLGRAGLRTLAALIGAAALLTILLPAAVIRGFSPVAVAMPIALCIAVGGTLLISGSGRRGLAAGLGTVTTLLAIVLFPFIITRLMHLTGFDVSFGPHLHLDVRLWYDAAFAKVDFHGLLVAALLLGSLGAVMDVAMTIAASVGEAADSEHDSFGHRFTVGWRVGGRVLGPMLATMLLVFAGVELLPTVARAGMAVTFFDAVGLTNYESIATQLVETLSAGLGILCTIPLTALFAAWLLHPTTPPVEGAPPEGGAS